MLLLRFRYNQKNTGAKRLNDDCCKCSDLKYRNLARYYCYFRDYNFIGRILTPGKKLV